ncbi:putative DNA-directed RNA polymerase subunit delta [Candidatus Izimaplasma bacterium HR1]|jgi:DNA-directed RNA polymerase subunit delta|uniref:DNA-directed RNA polymerase subunit delta n=1 Tax=Candidatus Izimoplasma sp. HR1 TaxID=1541959 RepID=UPI0004F82D0A|nr:putative DNA-directed RNA polymerase subunit delta [Candidatus Izimaplasma bacterium HR1]
MKAQKSLIDAAVELLEVEKKPYNLYQLFDKVTKGQKFSEDAKADAVTKFYTDLTTSAKFVYTGDNQWDLKANQKIELWEKDGSFYKEYTKVDLPDEYKPAPKPKKATKTKTKAKPKAKAKVVEVVEPVIEKVVEPVIEKVVEPVIEKTVEPVIEPVVESVAKPDDKKAAVPVTDESGKSEVVETYEEEVFEEFEDFDEDKYNEYMDTYEDQYKD